MAHQLNWPSIKYFLKDYLLALVYEDYKRWPYCCQGFLKKESYSDFFSGFKTILTKGYVPYEISDLCDHLAPLILPRLQRFRKVVYSHPADMTFEEWEEKLDKMLFSFQFVVDRRGDDVGADDESTATHSQVEEGFQLFGAYFRHLWL